MAVMLTLRLPGTRTFCPGPWPCTSALGDSTRRYSQGRRKRLPSSKATSNTCEARCRTMSMGLGDMEFRKCWRLGLAARAGVGRVVPLGQVLEIEVGVDLRGGDVGV